MAAADAPDSTASDPYAREAQIFPRLPAEMVGHIGGYGTEEQLATGTVVFERGERSVDFFLVLAGSIEIFDHGPDGNPNVITVHGENQFALASPYATTQSGNFAVGDVRAGSVKRVASGVGEGSVVIQAVHRFLDPITA